MLKRTLLLVIAVCMLSPPAWSQQAVPTEGKDLQCPDANVFGKTLITGICWSCMFPVYLAGLRMFRRPCRTTVWRER